MAVRRRFGDNMKTISVFVDTTTVNRILDIAVEKSDDPRYEEDRAYLSQIVANYAKKGIVQLIVNPTVKNEIENTKKPKEGIDCWTH